jgi:hypothetical protein
VSLFSDHINKVVADLGPLACDEVAKALIRERVMEARHIAERIRTKGGHLPALAAMVDQLEDRASHLDKIANNWPEKTGAKR